MKKITANQIITTLATVATITINALANILPLNGLNTGEISDRFEIFFVPAGYVFSIWSIIYLGLLVYTVFQALPAQRENSFLKRIAPYYWLSSLANIVWIFLWHYEVFSWTILFMLVILASLLFINRNLSAAEGLNKWLVKLTFSVYLGWISVATIANAAQWLYYLGWNGWGVAPQAWAVIMIAVASLLGILMNWFENDSAYSLVLIWAFIGITVSQAGVTGVVTAAWIGTGLVGLSLLAGGLKFKRIY